MSLLKCVSFYIQNCPLGNESGYFCFISLLKGVLARWFLDVSFQVTFLQITVILETDMVTFGSQNLSFGMPGASTLAPWGTMGRSRGTWGLKKGDLGVQAWMTESTL